jgi:hypothetical protein
MKNYTAGFAEWIVIDLIKKGSQMGAFSMNYNQCYKEYVARFSSLLSHHTNENDVFFGSGQWNSFQLRLCHSLVPHKKNQQVHVLWLNSL